MESREKSYKMECLQASASQTDPSFILHTAVYVPRLINGRSTREVPLRGRWGRQLPTWILISKTGEPYVLFCAHD